MVEIRDTKVDDIEGYLDVMYKTWRTTYTGIVDEDFMTERENKRDERVEQAKKEFGILEVDGRKSYNSIAVDGDKVVGFATYGKMREEKDFGLTNSGEIYAIYVLKEYQGIGIGKELINFAVGKLKDKEWYDNLVIWTLAKNPSVKFYWGIGGEERFKKDVKMGMQILEQTGFWYSDLNKFLERTKTKSKKIYKG